MRAKVIYSICLLLLAAWVNTVHGQEAILRLDTTAIPIGGQAQLELALQLPSAPAEPVSWPTFTDTITHQIEVIESMPVDTLTSKSKYELVQLLTVTSFDTGYIVVPPVRFGLGGETIESNPVLLRVESPIVEGELRDVKDIVEVEYGFVDVLMEHIWWIIGTCIVLALIVFMVRRWRKRPPEVTVQVVPEPERQPPHEEALQALDALAQKSLWQKGEVKAYHSELSDILRTYIERRYHVRTMERTTRQILTDLRMAGMPLEAYERLKATLQLADVVKFAKFTPEPEEHASAMDNARLIVEQTSQTAMAHG